MDETSSRKEIPMSEPRLEDLLVRIHQLERSNRLWKALALGGAVFLLLVVGGFGVLQHRALEAAQQEAARAQEAEVRARQAAERASYAHTIQMADHLWEHQVAGGAQPGPKQTTK
jgi:hypothetical protein